MIATVSALLLVVASCPAPTPSAAPQEARRRVVPPPGTFADARAVEPSHDGPLESAGPERARRRMPADVSFTGTLGGGLSWPPGTQALQWSARCMEEIQDLASGACLTASSTPVLGSLYPLGPELNIDAMGNVGIGTTTPSSKLEVAGAARINGALTLAPSGDQALDLSTGSVYKNGTLFMHTKGWRDNTAVGSGALSSVSVNGYQNTAVGSDALQKNDAGNNTAVGAKALSNSTGGYNNTAVGAEALRYNTSYSSFYGGSNTAVGFRAARMTNGAANTAVGSRALESNSVGLANTAIGALALSNTSLDDGNTACGAGALAAFVGARNTSVGAGSMASSFGFPAGGNGNIALGYEAGISVNGDDNILIGNQGLTEDGTIRVGTAGKQTRAFLAGVRSTTTGLADAIPVMVDSAGQLGTVSSSRRYKQDVHDMGASTDRLLLLRPVVFRYKDHVETMGDSAPVEYGLIAEEVAEIFPELVVRDEAGEPLTVKYHLLSSMLLNELKESNERSEARDRRTKRELEELRARVAELERRE